MNKLIYIAGYPRSGTTLIGNILGECDHVIAIGEPIFFPNPAVTTRQCACGDFFADCPFWSGRLKLLNFDDFHSLPLASFRGSLALLATGSFNFHQGYLRRLQELYDSLYASKTTTVVIDESKFPLYLYALLQLERLDIRVVHMVRDPRAVAFSWTRVKPKASSGGYMERYHPISTARRWLVDNWLVERLSRLVPTHRLRYEDFVESPKETVDRLLSWAGIPDPGPFISSSVVHFRKQHHLVASNPVGKTKGELKILADHEWQRQMELKYQWLVTAICWPLMLRYGYLRWR